MYGEYPIVLGGETRGEVRVYPEGLMTVFEATAEDPGAMLRLSVYGGGAEGYLGVMAPCGEGRVSLRRRLSRAALSGFPEDIELAAPAGGLPAPPLPAEPEAAPASEAGASQAGEALPAAAEEAPSAAEPSPEPDAQPPPAGEGDTLWFTTPDGALTTFDGQRSLVALPADELRLPRWAAGAERVINGRKYIVFPR